VEGYCESGGNRRPVYGSVRSELVLNKWSPAAEMLETNRGGFDVQVLILALELLVKCFWNRESALVQYSTKDTHIRCMKFVQGVACSFAP